MSGLKKQSGWFVALVAGVLAFGQGSQQSAFAQPAPDTNIVDMLRSLPPEQQRTALRRHLYFYEQKAGPDGRIPPRALERALDQHERTFGPRPQGLTAGPDAPFGPSQWTFLGPSPIATNLTNSGRVNSIVVDPSNTNVIYIGAATGGVWKSTTGGASWTPLTDGQCSLAMGSIALNPTNTQIVYAGTGEENFSGDSYYGCGVLKSTDGGASWTRTGASVFATTTGGASIGKVAVHPTSTSTLMVASTFGVHRSLDAGGSYTQTLTGTATDVAIHPTTPNVMYAAVGAIFGAAANGVYKSVDTGATWTKVAGGFPTASVGRIQIAVAPSAPSTIYAAVSSTGLSLLGIWKSTDDGATWTQLTATGASCASQCWYDMNISVDPTNANIVYFSGFSLYKSTDGGSTFTDIGTSIHVDHHALAFMPGAPTTVFAGSDGGVFKSTNGGASWTSLNPGLGITQFYPGLALHPSNASIYMGGTQDNGTLTTSGAQAWTLTTGGDGGFAAIDFSNPAIAYGETQWSASSGFSGPRKSTTFGTTNSFSLATTGINLADSALFIPPLIMSPTVSSRLYFGTTKVYKTTNSAGSWTAATMSTSSAITYIAEAPSNGNIVYAATSGGSFIKSTDGAVNFSTMTAPLAGARVSTIVVHPTDANTVFAAIGVFSGSPSRHVYKSTDGASTWTSITGNLPDIPVTAMVIDPTAPTTTIMIGTDLGVYITRDGGATWTPFNNGLPLTAIHDLKYNASTGALVAATHGRGVWRAFPIVPRTIAHDFNGDGTSDILWRDTSGVVANWHIVNAAIASGPLVGGASSVWSIQGTGDFNGDNKSDILWRDNTGLVAMWLLNGATITSGPLVGQASTAWTIAGTGDFDGDGKTDVLWRGPAGEVAIWFMNGSTITGSPQVAAVSTNWTIAGVGDFNGDGKADILWREAGGTVGIWFMNGAFITSAPIVAGAPTTWTISGAGDFDGDGMSDVLWRGPGGEVAVWFMNGPTLVSGPIVGGAGFNWTIAGTGDFNADGKSDVLWRETGGVVAAWLMNGATLLGGPLVGGASSAWAIQRMGN